MNGSRRLARLLCAAVLAAGTAVAPGTAAQEEPTAREAAKHFQRGVVLYGEADYRSALVEFKRAFAIAPNAAVLYNVGETEFQLQDYAAALKTFRHFLAEAPAADGRRGEVENSVEVLKSRVGHLSVTTVPSGAEISVDDQPMGKTPVEDALLVTIGHRKVTATMAGRAPVVRYVDVAADDNLSVTLPFAAAEGAGSAQRILRDTAPVDGPAPQRTGPGLRIAGWVATGVLAGGAAAFGVLAEKAGADLKDARNSYPTTASVLGHDASVTTTYSIVADSLTAAAVVIGGITLYSTLASSSSPGPQRRGSSGGTRVVLGPASARVQLTF